MGSNFDSFQKSALGAFIQSDLNARGVEATEAEIHIFQAQLIQDKSTAAGFLWWTGEKWDSLIYGPEDNDLYAMAVYEDLIHVGSSSNVYRWIDGAWEDLNLPESPTISAMEVHDGKLYVVGSSLDGKMWEWDGSTWANNHTIQDTPHIKVLRSYGGKLFLGTRNAGFDTTIRYNGTDYEIDGCGYFDGTDWHKAHDRAHLNTGQFIVTLDGRLWATGISPTCPSPVEPPGVDNCPDRLAVWDADTEKFIGWDENRSPQSLTRGLGNIGADYYASGVNLWKIEAPSLDDMPNADDSWVDTTLNFNTGPIDGLSRSDGTIWFAGPFSNAGGVTSPGVIIWDGADFSPHPSHPDQQVFVGSTGQIRLVPAYTRSDIVFRACGTWEQMIYSEHQQDQLCVDGQSQYDYFYPFASPIWVLTLIGPLNDCDMPCGFSTRILRYPTDTEKKIASAVGQTTGLSLVFDSWDCASGPGCLETDWWCGPTSQGTFIRTLELGEQDGMRWEVMFPPGEEPDTIDECFILTLGA
jgi:hypothetical protein